MASVLLGITFSVYGGSQLVAHADTTDETTEQTATTSKQTSSSDQSAVALKSTTTGENAEQSSNNDQKSITNTNDDQKNAQTDATADQTQSNSNATTELDTTNSNVASTAVNNAVSKVATTSTATDTNDESTITVSTAQEFIDAIQNGTATTINVANNINLGDVHKAQNYGQTAIKNKRNITIQSSDGERKTVDFNGYSFNMNNKNYSVTFKDLIIYGRNYYGPIENAGSFTFDNVDYTGSEMVYTTVSSNITFKNNVSAHTVDKYTSPLDGTEYSTDKGQQVIQFTTGTNNIIFESGSNVTLTTDNGDVIKNSGNATTITVKNGANVTINPHASTKSFEANTGQVALGIVSAGGSINVEQGGNLTFNLSQNSGDPYMPGAIYLTNGATITDNGNIKINVNGQPSTGNSMPVYVSGDSTIKVGNGAAFEIAAKNLGSYAGSLFKIDGTGTVELDPHSTFKISGDGTGAVAGIELGSGSIFTSDQPEEFTIDLSANNNSSKALIKNGTIKFTRVKTMDVDDPNPLAKVDATYDKNGEVADYEMSSQDQDTLDEVAEYLENKDKINFIAAGKDVTLSDVHYDETTHHLTGKVSAPAEGIDSAYVFIYVDGQPIAIGSDENKVYNVYTLKKGEDDSSKTSIPYAATLPGEGATFDIDLSDFASKLTKDTKITVVASRYFVESNPVEEAVPAPKKTDVNKQDLEAAVNEAPTVESGENYTNADVDLQKAYTDAIDAGKKLIANDSATQTEVNDAVTAINNAKEALNGEKNKAASKEALQKAVNEAPTVKTTDPAYYNGSADAKKAYDDAVAAGQGVLNKNDATVAEITNALNAINTAKSNLDGKATDKNDLQTAVDNSSTVKNSDNYASASQDAKDAYDSAISEANTVLANENSTQAQVDEAKQKIADAQSKLNGISNLKDNAKKEIQTALATKLKEISDATNIDQATKDQLTADANKAADAANTAIDNASDANDIESAKNTGISDINNVKVPSLADAKDAANKAIDDALNTKKTEINNAANIDQATKDSLIKDATDAANTAKEAINNAKTNNDVATEQTKGTDAIDAVKVPSVADSQNAAKAVIEEALNKKKSEINGATNIDQATKDNLIKEATDAADAAKKVIDQATTAETIKKAVDDGTTNINNVKVPSLDDAKNAAKDAVDTAATKQKELINNSNNLSDSEKQELNNQVDAAAKAAKDTIDAATTNDGATKAGQDGVAAIEKVIPTSLEDAKKAASDAVEAAATKQKALINNANNLSDGEKQDLNNQVDAAAKAAKDAINAATTNDGATKAGQDGVAAIEEVVPTSLDDAKKAAKQLVDDALAKKLDEIKANTNLTDDEKAKLTNDAKDKIQSATTNDGATKAGQDGKIAIEAVTVPTDSDVKKNAKDAIDRAAKAKNDAINDSNLTDEEKNTLKKQVADKVKAAKDNIDAATKDADVSTAQTNGENAIDAVEIPDSASKTAAINAINTALADKKAVINGTNLTDEEKSALVNKAQKLADDAIANVNKATTNDAVNTAKENGVQDIQNMTIPTVSDVKQKASANIDDVAKAAKHAIDNTNGLTDSEKQAAKDQVDADAKAAKEAIAQADSNDAVTDAVNKGIVAINKDAANAAIDGALAEKNNSIDAAPNLTDEEKQAVKDQAKTVADNAKTDISNASTVAAVESAKNTGVDNINKVSIPAQSKAKQDAIKAIDKALKQKTDAINAASYLTNDEKQSLTDQANEAADNAKSAINTAQDNDAVKKAQIDGVNNINGITVPESSQVKQDAKEAVKRAADAKINNINNASNLTREEKDGLIKQVNDIASKANDDIDKATMNVGVQTAKTNGINNINDVVIPESSQTKQDAIKAIDDAAKAKKAAINNSAILTNEEKQELIDHVNDSAEAAKKAIESATDKSGVDSAKNDGLKKINDLEIPTNSKAKDAAIAEIDAELNKKLDAINNNFVLVAEEKDALTNEANTAADKAKAAINNAASNADVEAEKDKGITNIQNVDNPAKSQVKESAKAAVQAAADSKINAIDNAPNLTAEEKAELVKQVNDIASNAKANIDNSSSSQSVETARDNGISAIEAVEIPTVSKTKDDANSDLDNTANAAKKAIDETSGLTDDQKQTAKDQIDKAVDDAKENIKNASDNQGVADATDAGKLAINKISAKAAIDAAVAAKKSEIAQAPLTAEEAKPLNNLVDQEADAAKAAIDNANTSAAVETAKNNGVETINNIKVPTTSATKDDANKAIDDALANKIKEINNANLTDDQKQSLIDQAQNAATQAKENIRNASTDEDVQTAKNNGIAAIEGITVKSNSADDKDNSATNAGNGNQTGHFQSDSTGDVTNPSAQHSGRGKDQLPQTGDEIQHGAGLIGLALAGLVGLLGSAGFRKKRD